MGSAYWVIVVLILAPLRFHDLPGLIVATALFWFANFVRRHRSRWKLAAVDGFHSCVKTVLDWLDAGRYPIARRALPAARWAEKAHRIRRLDYPRILIWAFFIYAAYLRLYDSLTHSSFGFFDPYVVVVYLKQLNAGDLYGDAIYPRGLHAFLSAMGTISGISPNALVHFAGGLIGTMIPFAFYFLLLECRIPWTGALVGTSLMGICGFFEAELARQTATLPEEFALVFGLGALAFAVRFLRLGIARDRLPFIAASLVTWCAHGYVGLFLLFAYAALALDYLLRRPPAPLRAWILTRDCVFCAIAGNLYVLIGLLFGHHIHKFAVAMITGGEPTSGLALHWDNHLIDALQAGTGTLIVPVLALCAVPLALFGVIWRRGSFPTPAFFSLLTLAMGALWLLRVWKNVNTVITPERLIFFLEFSVCGIAAYLYTLLVEPLLDFGAAFAPMRAACVTLTLALLLCISPADPPQPLHPQYEECAQLCYDLSKRIPRGMWTIVGQAEEFELVLGAGLHMNVSKFLSDYVPEKRNLFFPTPYTFIIYEKKPIPMDPIFVKPERILQEAFLGDWLKVYQKNHKDLRLYQETPDVAIYLIYQPDALLRRGSNAELD